MGEVVYQNKAPGFMGGIHPRFKREVGRRLALAYLGSNGPTLASCSMQGTSAIVLHFNKTSLQDDQLKLQWDVDQYNISTWGTRDSSSLMVCVQNPDAAIWRESDCLNDPSLWTSAPLRANPTSDGDDATLLVDLSGLA